ncbi:L,D-transpeptidase family protein [Streptomyces sp. XM4193]|uniref:L,D-transpeptidase family protein n=1 Tax=Streptomyces sp. XM4193 TaxID=2929782 RepID=UPI001FF7972D|nr:L,D-transpeptidase family protein [Streptomyces sp. XM4193]MCK1795588.1 L,D-transpeptidase family protein [Streptomyces sp. XM4193]
MRADTRALRALCGAVAVAALSLTVGCDEIHIETDANGQSTSGASAGSSGGGATGGNSGGADNTDSGGADGKDAGTDDRKPAGDPKPKPEPKPDDPNAGLPTPLLKDGSEGKQVREAQARLQQLALFERNPSGYYGTMTTASVKALQKKAGLAQSGTTDAGTWAALRKQTKAPSAAQLNPQTSYPLADPDKRCTSGRVLCISKESRTLAWMVDGEVRAAMDVRFGSQYTPTREGTFKVDFKSRDHHSTLYDTPMPYAMFFSGGQAVHYSDDFAAAGYSGASHGCVNVREKKKIAQVFSQVKAGDKVIVYS